MNLVLVQGRLENGIRLVLSVHPCGILLIYSPSIPPIGSWNLQKEMGSGKVESFVTELG